MTGKRKLNWLFGYQAVVYAAGLLLATGLVSDWGAWYSTSTAYRDQTDALFQGNLAVSEDVHDLKFDHTWSEGGVHQVWGLGVPLWRFPFEAAARLFGFEAFPDRIALGLFALLVGFVSLKIWLGVGDDKSEGGGSGWRLITGLGAGFVILLLFPPFLTLLQTRGAVWEEAISYEYLFGVLLLAVLVAFVRSPSVARLLIVCGLAGFGGLVRPTLVFYGFAAVVVAVIVWLDLKGGQVSDPDEVSESATAHEHKTHRPSDFQNGTMAECEEDRGRPQTAVSSSDRLQTCPPLGRALVPVLLGIFLYCLGGGMLWLTNLKRFGNGFEFGHKLNVQTLYGSMYATRFDDPFQNEPLADAGKEVFGAVFLAERFNNADWYQENIFPGQSPTVRWREFYFRTFDWTYLPFLLLGWVTAIAAALRVGRWPLGDGRLRMEVGEHDAVSADSFTVMAAGLWSLMAAVAAAWLLLASRCQRNWTRVLACVLLCGWVGTEHYLSRSAYDGPSSITWEKLKVVRESRESKEAKPPDVSDRDELGDDGSGIPFDRVGWNQETGALMPMVILFVKDADFLELELETREHPLNTPDPEAIRAKIGLEYLERDRITKTEKGWKIRFRGPQRSPWKSGLQTAFVATVPNAFLAERTTPWILESVRWR